MGGTTSKNEVDITNTSMINAVRSITNKCSSAINSNQVLDIVGNTGKVNTGDVNFNQAANVNFSCLQSNDTKTDLSNQIDNVVKQQSQSISQFFQLSSSKSENVTNLVNNLGISIENAFNNQCITTQSLYQTAQIRYNTGDVTTGNLNFKQSVDDVVNCVQNNKDVIDAKNALQNSLNQQSTAQTKGLFDFLFGSWGWLIIVAIVIIILIIAGVAAFFIFQQRKTSEKAITEIAPQLPAIASAATMVAAPEVAIPAAAAKSASSSAAAAKPAAKPAATAVPPGRR